MERVLEPEAMDTAEEAVSYDAMDHTQANSAFVERLFELGARGTMLEPDRSCYAAEPSPPGEPARPDSSCSRAPCLTKTC